MQEIRIRLLRENPKHKSGFRIVGWFSKDVFGDWYSDKPEFQVTTNIPIYSDALELGERVGEEWIYAGDRVERDGVQGTILYDCMEWFIAWDDGEESLAKNRFTPLATFWGCGLFSDFIKRIGTIHDEVRE